MASPVVVGAVVISQSELECVARVTKAPNEELIGKEMILTRRSLMKTVYLDEERMRNPSIGHQRDPNEEIPEPGSELLIRLNHDQPNGWCIVYYNRKVRRPRHIRKNKVPARARTRTR